MSDPYEREAAKAAINTLERELATARELAESNGKLAHDAAIDAMRYRDQLKIAVDALDMAAEYIYEALVDYDSVFNRHRATEQGRKAISDDLEKVRSLLERELASSNTVSATLLTTKCRELAEVTKQRDLLIEGLEKLASCDWVITLPDRMDAVREIASETLNKITP